MDDKFDCIVGGFGANVGEPELRGGNNGCEVAFDFFAQFSKYASSASLGPSHPFGQGTGNFIRFRLERQTQFPFAQIITIEPGVALVKNCSCACWWASNQASRRIWFNAIAAQETSWKGSIQRWALGQFHAGDNPPGSIR